MDYPLNHVLTFDVTTNSLSTGGVVDADSAPTFEVFEDTTDTDIGVGGSFTKRTSKTGNYKATITLSAANGFEVGKMYNIIATGTVGSVTGKTVVMTFRVGAAEGTVGIYPSDMVRINNDATAASNLSVSAKSMKTFVCQTGTLSSTQASTDLADATADVYKGRLVVFTSGNRIRNVGIISAYTVTGGILTFSAITGAPANGDTGIIV